MKQVITVLNRDYIVVPYIKTSFRCHADIKKLIFGSIEDIKTVIENSFNVSNKVVPLLNQRLINAVTMMLDATVVQFTEQGKLWCDENDFDSNAKHTIQSINSNGTFDLFDELKDFTIITQIPQEFIVI